MNQSLTYYITLFALKLKGIKKTFSQNPIDFKKLRKEDIHHSKGSFFKKNTARKFQILNTSITEVSLNDSSTNLLIFIHGGAFVSGPSKHHWDVLQKIITQTNYTGWMCNYPKAPEAKISEISKNIDAIYANALKKYHPKQIILIGDSVGGTLITALIQRAVQKNLELPKSIILVSPVMDASMSNPKIKEIDKIDPMLSKLGVLSAKKMCAENDELTNKMISPIYGSFKNFPQTTLFVAENDITYPDQVAAIQKFDESGIAIEIIKGTNMPHIWPFLPVMEEAKIALKQIIAIINA